MPFPKEPRGYVEGYNVGLAIGRQDRKDGRAPAPPYHKQGAAFNRRVRALYTQRRVVAAHRTGTLEVFRLGIWRGYQGAMNER